MKNWLVRVAGWVKRAYSSVSSYSGGWYPWSVREPFAGAWQRNITADGPSSVVAFSAVFACITGIAADIAKMRIKLTENQNGIWTEITEAHGNSKLLSPLSVLAKPNHYQNRIKFIEQWIVSKLLYGNAYILKERDESVERGKPRPVRALYVLHPQCVKPLVAEDGGVYYDLDADKLSQISEHRIVPASEIIHDMMVSLWHPLVGVSPIYACGISATMGNRIQSNSMTSFQNLSRPGGMVTFPGTISQKTADDLKKYWETEFSGNNIGKIAVAGDGGKFEPFSMPAVDMQLIEQLKWTVEDVARAFHYPLFKLGGDFPPYSSGPETLSLMYYTDALHPLIEAMELCLDEGLELPRNFGTECDLDTLLRMDTASLYESNNKASDWLTIDEQRARANRPPLPVGGNTVYRQEQDHSIEAIAKRDSQENPFGSKTPPPAPKPAPEPMARELDPAVMDAMYLTELQEILSARED